MARCLYCGTAIYRGAEENAENRQTRDHVYPMSLIRRHLRGVIIDEKIWDMNLVDCCRPCNMAKAAKHPLDWLIEIPDPKGAARLAQHLVKMGEDMGEVFKSMRRRNW